MEPAEVSFLFVLRSKTNSSPNGIALRLPNIAVDFISVSLLSSTRLVEATLLKVFLLVVGLYCWCGAKVWRREYQLKCRSGHLTAAENHSVTKYPSCCFKTEC
ncbi:hypothetical protein AVEN_22021-1 [Araneus ventricosus]|uniref:Uncharacterized protein n=1 Tax=Araneus ventricosus TaxID=182803 RepID=A0A4Y2HS13_ARAVE|nr:hypothetical protein AVEN_22021-1 [Araneus ventricosus]